MDPETLKRILTAAGVAAGVIVAILIAIKFTPIALVLLAMRPMIDISVGCGET